MAEETKNCCCSQRRKVRERTEEEALLQRLSRIEGQVRGVRGMVENSAYCTDILTQVSAIQSALNAFNRELLARHIRTCVVTDIQKGDLDVVRDVLWIVPDPYLNGFLRQDAERSRMLAGIRGPGDLLRRLCSRVPLFLWRLSH